MQAADSDRLRSLRKLFEQDPGDGFVLYGLAQECAKLGRHDEALGWYDRASEADPKQCYGYFHKAKSLEALGRRQEAAETLRTGLARARAIRDLKAAGELEAALDEYE